MHFFYHFVYPGGATHTRRVPDMLQFNHQSQYSIIMFKKYFFQSIFAIKLYDHRRENLSHDQNYYVLTCNLNSFSILSFVKYKHVYVKYKQE